MLGACERVLSVDRHHVGADPVDPGAHLRQQPGQVLDVGLAGGVADRGRARGERRRHQGVLGSHHRRLVHEDPAGLQPVRRCRQLDPAIAADPRPELGEGVEVGVEAAAADEVAPRRRHPRLAEARQQRPGEQEGSADPAREVLVDLRPGDRRGSQADAVVGHPHHFDAEPLKQRQLGLGVADPRHVVDQQLVLGQQAGGEDRQGGVLVAGRGDLTAQRHASLYDEFLHWKCLQRAVFCENARGSGRLARRRD